MLDEIPSKLYCFRGRRNEVPREVVTSRLIEEPDREECICDCRSDPGSFWDEIHLKIAVIFQRIGRDNIKDFLCDHKRDRLETLRQALEELRVIGEENR